MSTSYVMKVSSNGQVSIPAEARGRWQAEKMLVVDLGDRLVMRPLPDDALPSLIGKYKGGPTTAESRRRGRADDAAADRQKRK